MTKRVVLSIGSPGVAAIDADLADLATEAGDGSQFLAGYGTFKTPSGGGGGGSLQRASVSLTSEQILNLNTSPVQIVAAPGAGIAINLISSFYSYAYGTTAYSAPNNPQIFYAGDTGLTLNLDGSGCQVFQESYSAVAYNSSGGGSNYAPASMADNSALIIAVAASNPTSGDGTIKAVVYYTVESL
jgi:hypothetical protein